MFLGCSALAGDPEISFGVGKARLWLGRSQVVPVSVPSAPDRKVEISTSVSPPDAADVLLPATILNGETVGFLRVRALRAGKASLRVGGAVLPIEIVPDAAVAALDPRPEIICPPEGAAIHGDTTAGIEINPLDPHRIPGEPRLVLPDGRELAPRAQTLPEAGPTRLYVFDLPADELPPGPLELQCYAPGPDGTRINGEPVHVTVIRPDADAMVAGPCVQRVNDPRPERYGEKTPKVAKNDAAAPDGMVVNASADPAWCLQETIREPGHYQLTMRVRGDPAAGAFPSLGVMLNEEDRPATGSRVVDRGWHRIPIGGPIWLEAGEQTLTARFLNDFAHGKADRNLYLDRYELVRVDAAPTRPVTGEAMMMSGEPMMGKEGDDAMRMMSGTAVGAPARVSFARVLDGRLVQGPLDLRATVWVEKDAPAPVTELVVNGGVIASQQGRHPRYHVPLAALAKGSNTLQVRVRGARNPEACSPVESVVLKHDPPSAALRRILRYTVEDAAWDPGIAQRLEKDRAAAVFFTNGEAVLNLPESLEGAFDLRVDARGREFRGPPIFEVFLRGADGAAVKVGEVAVGRDREWPAGTVTLASGAKQIVLRFGNDLASKDGDRNIWLKALSLHEVAPGAAQPPRVAVVYPRPGDGTQNVFGAAAVVAEVYAPDGVEWSDLVLDGQPQKLRLADESGLGRVVLPLVADGLSRGVHRVQVLVRGRDGTETLSEPVRIRAVPRQEDADPAYARAVHLLNRFAYGPEPEQLADVLALGGEKWLRASLGASLDRAGERAALQRAWNEQPSAADQGQIVPRVISYVLRTPNPARTRFVLWAENHFSTWLPKAGLAKWDEHERFLALGAAPFGDLLLASATSPAMLTYLDQFRSFSRKINENYAREIMELHTVGVNAGYRQEDVTSLAWVLTGLTLSSEVPVRGSTREMQRAFRFDPSLNSPAERRVFGMEFPKVEDPAARLDRTLCAMEMLAAHPATARFICRKLAEHYVSVPAPDSLVRRLARRFRETGGDMVEVLAAVAASREFQASATRPKVAAPLDFSVRLARLSDSTNANLVRNFLRRSGTGLFDRATPDGYPEADAAYVNSNALLQRWRFSADLAGNLRGVVPASLVPPTREPWTPDAQKSALAVAAIRLTGRPLDAASAQAALTYLSELAPDQRDRARVVATVVAQLPQTGYR